MFWWKFSLNYLSQVDLFFNFLVWNPLHAFSFICKIQKTKMYLNIFSCGNGASLTTETRAVEWGLWAVICVDSTRHISHDYSIFSSISTEVSLLTSSWRRQRTLASLQAEVYLEWESKRRENQTSVVCLGWCQLLLSHDFIHGSFSNACTAMTAMAGGTVLSGCRVILLFP